MPVIVVGADTPLGPPIIDALTRRAGEVRAFVTDPDAAQSLKGRGVKVAVGDVSDPTHLAGAALNAFSAVAVGTAARDPRSRAFGDDPGAVLASWADAFGDAAVRRVIYLDDPPIPSAAAAFRAAVAEVAVVHTGGRSPIDVAAEVARLDDAAFLE